MRDIKIYVDDTKAQISSQLIGFKGEHLATQITTIIDLPDTDYKYRYVFKCDNVQTQTELLDEPIFLLPQKVVENDGLLIIQIIIYLDDAIIKTAQVEAYIGKALSVAEDVEDKTKGLTGISGNDIEMYQGETKDIALLIFDNDNNPYTLGKNDTLIFAFAGIVKDYQNPMQDDNGAYILHLDTADTKNITDTHEYNIGLKTTYSFNIICAGNITIKRSVISL